MKFLWVLTVALCALIFAQTTIAESANEADTDVVKIKGFESKLLHDVDDRGDKEDDDTLEDEDEADSSPAVITEKDIEPFKELGMERLARHLKSFHNHNLQRSNYNDNEIEDDLPEERAVRRRQRIRRRNTKNKIKRINRNRQVSNRKKNSRHKSKNKKSVRRRNTKKSKAKRTKKTRRNIKNRGVRSGGYKRSGLRSGARSGNKKRRSPNKTRRNRFNKGQQRPPRKSQNEELMHAADENVNSNDSTLQTPEKVVEVEEASD